MLGAGPDHTSIHPGAVVAWLQLSGSSEPFKARFPIAVDASALGSTADKDVTVTVPKTLDLFWTTIGSDGHDLRITDADGFTVIEHKRTTFNHANRSLTIDILGDAGNVKWQAQQSSIAWLWAYVGDADEVDIYNGTSPSGQLTGKMTAEAAAEVVRVGDPTPDRARPDNRRAKASGERRAFWFDFSPGLRIAQRAYSERLNFEEINFVEVSSVSGGSASSIEVEASTRFAGSALVRVVVSGGSDGSDHTLIVKATTITPNDTTFQVLEGRLLVQVRDQDDG